MPHKYRSRYSMVMYSHIPFSVALEAGAIQRQIREELCEGMELASDLDLDRARELIDRKLTPFLQERGITLDY